MFETLKNAFKNKEIRTKIFIVLGLLALFRLGCWIPVPGISASAFASQVSGQTFLELLSGVTGGALSNGAILALGVSPYITAEIVVQLLSMAIPSWERLAKEGEEGRKKLNKYTKILTLILATAQAIGIVVAFSKAGGINTGLFFGTEWLTDTVVVITLVAGALFTMWLGEKITETGIANMIVTMGNWHGATFAGLPTNTIAGSYYDFSDINQMKFWIKSDIPADKLTLFIQYLDAAQTEKTIAALGYADISDWTQITINKSEFTSKKLTTVIALGSPNGSCSVNNTVFITGIQFLNSSGNELSRNSVVAHISYKSSVTGTGASSSENSVTGAASQPTNTTGAKLYTPANPSDAASFTNIVWSDEFNGNSVDRNNWKFEIGNGDWGWGNNEQEYYTDGENAEVKDGALHITAKYDSTKKKYTSTRMITAGKQEFLYGKIEARMKFDEGTGSWPAFWMLGANINEGIGWPYCGEIDIMEHANSNDSINNTVHFNYTGSNPATAAYAHGEYGWNCKDNYWEKFAIDVTEWHTYTLIWTSTTLEMQVDGKKTFGGSVGAPGVTDGTDCFGKPFFILFNFAMGGLYVNVTNPDYFTNLPWNMYVDYVRVYQ